MKKLCSRFALAAVSLSLFTACEGSLPAPADLSMAAVDLARPALDLTSPPDLVTPTSPPDLVTCGVCDCGLQIYRVTTALYPAVTGTGAIVSDTCKTGLTAADVETSRKAANDAMGNISLYSSDGAILIGAGPVRCNKGTLTGGPIVISDGVCRYTLSNTVSFTVTADNAFDIMITQSRSNTMSEPGMACPQPATCTLAYKASHKM